MSNTIQDYQIAALAAGFTIGFGVLTVWEAIKQTRRNHNPLRSVYIYMVWGEILANLLIAIVGWLFLNGKLGPTIPVLFLILFLWVFEIQLLMQIIINRISLIVEHRSTIQKIKWGTVVLITAINIAVFIIWIPAHMVPPVSQTYVMVNNVWDKASKILILLVDAGLNWYFLRTVKIRIVKQHGLTKFEPLVGFNAKLMVLSIGMDALLIGLMFLKNQIVYIQFHPVVYIVKLKIEMSMASLVVRIAKGTSENDMDLEDNFKGSSSHHSTAHHSTAHHSTAQRVHMHSPPMKPQLLAGNVQPSAPPYAQPRAPPFSQPSAPPMTMPPTKPIISTYTYTPAPKPSVGTTVMSMRPTPTTATMRPQPPPTMSLVPSVGTTLRPATTMPKGKAKVNLYPQPFSNVMVKEKSLPHLPVDMGTQERLQSIFEDDKSPKKGVMHVFMHGHHKSR